MVLYDDKKWLSRLISTAFTIEDDSGICEKVLKERPHLGRGSFEDDGSSSDTSVESFDIREGTDHRRRSNTAIRLEKLEKKRKNEHLTQNVKVNPDLRFEMRLPSAGPSHCHFPTQPHLAKLKDRDKAIVNINTLLESTPNPSDVPFAQYAKYEGSGHPNITSKKMAIFLAFLPIKERDFPVKISIITTAKVKDIIGLTLWHASKQYAQLKLHPIEEYSLVMADDDGDYDAEFPCLDPLESVSKFTFHYLALLHHGKNVKQPKSTKITIKVVLPNKQSFGLQVESLDITVKDLLESVLKDSGWNKKNPVCDATCYHLEKLGHPTVEYSDLDASLSDLKCKEFCLVRNGSKSVQAVPKADPNARQVGVELNLEAQADIFPVMVSSGTFGKQRNAMCVIYGKDRMEIEYQTKTKTYPLATLSSVKYDASKSKVVVTFNPTANSGMVASLYVAGAVTLTLFTADTHLGNQLCNRLKSILTYK